MRGFSTIEILIALAILTTAITAVALVVFGMPFMVANMKMEMAAVYGEDAELSRIEHVAWIHFDQIQVVASTTHNGFEQALDVQTDQDEVSLLAHANTSWIDAYGSKRSSTLTTLLTNTSTDNPCDPFVSGTWTSPQTHLYALSVGDLLPSTISNDTYPISDVRAVGNTLIVAVRATSAATSSTLFFFDIARAAQQPVLIGNGFDNASSSRGGFAAITAGDGYAYAANGFGSASAQTCADDISCAQIQIFSLPLATAPKRVSAINLAVASPPYAAISGGSTAPASAVTYSHGLLFLGLQKTVAGDEFNIIDVHNPLHPRWISGIPIGRTVNRILVQNDFAYLGTDDNAQELVVIDVHDSTHPTVAGTWNASGSTGFGFGTALRIHNSTLLFGRSYVSNAPELSALNVNDFRNIFEVAHQDIGTLLNPDSVREFIAQDFLTIALTTKKLQFWKVEENDMFSEFAPSISLPSGSTGTSLACRENTLYVGLEQTSQGTGALEVITNS